MSSDLPQKTRRGKAYNDKGGGKNDLFWFPHQGLPAIRYSGIAVCLFFFLEKKKSLL